MLQFRGVSYLPVGVVLAASILAASGVVAYKSYTNYLAPTPNVLGASDVAVAGRCTDPYILQQSVNKLDRSMTLYAPDKTVTLGVGQFAKCMTVSSCTEDVNSCGTAVVTVKPACIADYLAAYNVGLTTSTTISGNNLTADFRKEDWEVNVGDLSQQIASAIEKEITYCNIVGESTSTKKSLGNLQVPVSNELPSMKGAFATHFIEVDKSRQVLFYWNDGVYQVFTVPSSAHIPGSGIYLARDVDFASLVSSIDKGYLQRTVGKDFPVVIHQ